MPSARTALSQARISAAKTTIGTPTPTHRGVLDATAWLLDWVGVWASLIVI
jgi:hypothetical protein